MQIDQRILQLAQGNRVSLIGPAGCGKTQIIVESALAAGGRQLVLTHTHAGVASLRARARKLGAGSDTITVDTVASWALRYALAFPVCSGISVAQPVKMQWNEVYAALAQLLTQRHVQNLIKRSYAGLFIDEYQDCTQTQHKLILTLATLIPTRVIGDPLQSIFDFNHSDPCVNFAIDVFPHFSRLPDLDIPHRWINSGNTKLGEWLLSIRSTLESGQYIDLSGAPVTYAAASPASEIAQCRRLLGSTETIIAIKQWRADCNRVAKNLGGSYVSIEAMDCDEWLAVAKTLEANTGISRVRILIEACAECAHVPHSTTSLFSPIIKALAEKKSPTEQQCGGSKALSQSIIEFVSSGSPLAALNILEAISQIPGMKVYRKDYWDEMKATFRLLIQEQLPIADAAWRSRDRTRTLGRHLPPKVISTTLLVKGLECDHGILLDADSYRGHRANLYVGMTRGSKSLTILARNPLIKLA